MVPLSNLRPETGGPLNVGPDTTKLLADTPVTGSENTSFSTTVWSDVTNPWAPEYGMVEYSCPTGLHSCGVCHSQVACIEDTTMLKCQQIHARKVALEKRYSFQV